MNFDFLGEYWQYFVSGTGVTIIISIFTIFFGTILGVALALMKIGKIAPLRWIANLYIEIFRGTPMLLQIFIGYISLAKFFPLPMMGVGILTIDLSKLVPGLIMISLNTGAYVAEIVRGGINSVDFGQAEAAGSLGLRPGQAMRYVILPQAVRNILPAMGNEFIVLIKDSALLAMIGINELMSSAQIVISNTYIPVAPYYVAGAIYLVLTFSTSRLLNRLETKMGKGYTR